MRHAVLLGSPSRVDCALEKSHYTSDPDGIGLHMDRGQPDKLLDVPSIVFPTMLRVIILNTEHRGRLVQFRPPLALAVFPPRKATPAGVKFIVPRQREGSRGTIGSDGGIQGGE